MAATAVAVAVVGHAIGYLGAAEAEVVNPSLEAVHFVAPLAQQTVRSNDLLTSVRGIGPVACRLVAQALRNQWGGGDIIPRWTLPGDGGVETTRTVGLALRGEVSLDQESALTAALGSVDDCERHVAAQLVGRIKDATLPQRLGSMLDSGPARARIGAALALGFGEWSQGVAPLVSALAAGDADLRATAAWALGRTEHVNAIGPLATALRDPAIEVRANAVVALGWIESTQAIGPLTDAFDDNAVQVRVNAAWALGRIDDPEAIPALTALLGSDADPEVRRTAAWALGRIE